MPAGFLTVVLLVLLLVVAFQVIFSFNRDLFRVGAYKELGRKALPLGALILMAATLPIVQTATAEWVPVAWAVTLGGGIILANFFSMPALERKASRQFRRGRHAEAAEGFRSLAEDKPLARYYAFLGAALGASEEKGGDSGSPNSGGNGSSVSRSLQGSIDASTKAIELDPDYGVAYYNRALIHQKAGKRSKAAKDMQRALEADLPKRFRTAAKRYLEQK
jgi:tetratricopeptide (TPR) repeat protein